MTAKFQEIYLVACLLLLVLVPGIAAAVYEVQIVNGKFSPENQSIQAGDSVKWIGGTSDFSIVETIGLLCVKKIGGFDSGRKTPGQSYMRTFPKPGTIYYKSGIGAQCLNGLKGTITVV